MKLRFALLGLLLLPLACTKPDVEQPGTGEPSDPTTYYANMFAFNNMKTFYLWADEMAGGFSNWTYGDNPVEKVASLRYKDAAGNLIDKWTELMEDCSSFESSITGNGKSFGMDFVLYRTENNRVVIAVTFTFAGSPAEKAGLKRGDIIVTLDGDIITMDNYAKVLNEKIYNSPGTLKLELRDGRSLTMTAQQLYSNPVQMAKTLVVDGKRIGYLHFTNFTLDACKDLEEVFRQFKADGIEELILDLRYNSGGYATTATVLASMIAPADAVTSGSVFIKDVYNSTLGPSMSEETCFQKSFNLTLTGGKTTVNALEVNPGIKRLWAITTGHSASASEMILCGLKPYMDVTLIGSSTYGKYCGGYLITSQKWFDALASEKTDVDCAAGRKATAGWGLYVIASRYADCNGITLSMPSGIPANYEAFDDPADGYQLGDPSETMLAIALSKVTGKQHAAPDVKSAALDVELPYDRPGSKVLVY